jgi:hypothetical protein
MTLLHGKRTRIDLLGDYDQQDPNQRIIGISEGSTVYQRLLAQYKGLNASSDYDVESREDITTVLSPTQINDFLALVLAEDIDTKHLGSFVTHFLKNAWLQGERDFKLNLGSSSLNYLFSKDHALGDFRFLNITVEIDGNVGSGFGTCAVNSFFKANDFGMLCFNSAYGLVVHGNRYGFASGSSVSDCTFYGDTFGKKIGTSSTRSRFVGQIFGDKAGHNSSGSNFEADSFGEECGLKSRGSIFTAKTFGERPGIGSTYCTYRTTESRTLQQLLEEVPKKVYNNVILLDDNGEILEFYGPRW